MDPIKTGAQATHQGPVVEGVVEAGRSGYKGVVLLSSVGKVDVESILLAVDHD